MTAFVFLAVGALADAPLQARLLTREEIAEAPVTKLSVPQLQLELGRAWVEEPMWRGHGYALLAHGIAGLLIAAVAGSIGLDQYLNARTRFIGPAALISWGAGAAGLVTGLIGAVLLAVATRQEGLAARRAEVVRQLEAIRTGATPAPLPESSQHAAELIRITDERPTLALPIVMAGLGGGLTLGGATVLGQLRQSPRAEPAELAFAIVATCAGVLLAGAGIYNGIAVAQERSEIDARIAELKALPPPVDVNDYWHF